MNITHLTTPALLSAILLATAGCSNGDERPMMADVAAAANVTRITELKCDKTNDGKPGYLCWFKSPEISSYAEAVRVQKGFFGWKKISN
ncbi:hypothetical protein [Agrobacterium sp. LAD9]|uniref:hypothetical protein n=1 Tax=Agrobacterium sp. LAD9 TaxID=2055153 RepID=UPI000D1F7319|nr:hypothetical protein [Agrobacterium sp. LAD9]